MISVALADTLNVKDLVSSSGSSLSDYFAAQFEALTPFKVIIALVMGLVVGLLVAFTYRKCYRGVLYSPNFAMTLVMLTLITTPVVMCIKSDISLSMGMVGALSIVRFRTAVKEPMDTAYMFWALTMGILLGAELYVVALVVALGIAVILFGMTFIKFSNPNNYLLVIHYAQEAEYDVQKVMDQLQHKKLRSKTLTPRSTELTYEVRVRNAQDVVASVQSINGVLDATLVSCQSEAGA